MVCYCSADNDQNITVCHLLLGSDDKFFMMQLMFQMKIYCTNWYIITCILHEKIITTLDLKNMNYHFNKFFSVINPVTWKKLIKNTYKTSYLFHPTLFFFIIFAELFLEMIGFPVNLINTLIHIVLNFWISFRKQVIANMKNTILLYARNANLRNIYVYQQFTISIEIRMRLQRILSLLRNF